MATDIGTLAGFKSWKGIVVATDDTRIQTILDGTNAEVARFCGFTASDSGHYFISGTYTEYQNGLGTDSVMLFNTPVSSITSVDIVEADGTLTRLDSSTYRVNGATGRLCRVDSLSTIYDSSLYGNLNHFNVGASVNFPVGFQNVKTIYVAGQTVPKDLELAVYEIVNDRLKPAGFRAAPKDAGQADDFLKLYRHKLYPFQRIYI
jgi:hypothetical protein